MERFDFYTETQENPSKIIYKNNFEDFEYIKGSDIGFIFLYNVNNKLYDITQYRKNFNNAFNSAPSYRGISGSDISKNFYDNYLSIIERAPISDYRTIEGLKNSYYTLFRFIETNNRSDNFDIAYNFSIDNSSLDLSEEDNANNAKLFAELDAIEEYKRLYGHIDSYAIPNIYSREIDVILKRYIVDEADVIIKNPLELFLSEDMFLKSINDLHPIIEKGSIASFNLYSINEKKYKKYYAVELIRTYYINILKADIGKMLYSLNEYKNETVIETKIDIVTKDKNYVEKAKEYIKKLLFKIL